MAAVSGSQIKAVLNGLGIRPGDSVLLHSSRRKVGPVEGGADAVIDAFLETLGPQGNLLVPTLPFLGSTFEYLEQDPVFDVRNTPSKMGIVTEVLRQRPEAVRSLHPTHSVAGIGPRVRGFIKDHERSITPCSRDLSPFGRLVDAEGKIVLLGVTNQNNTTLHACEEYAEVPYLFAQKEFDTAVIDYSGKTVSVHIKCHAPDNHRNFDIVEPILAEKGIMKRTQIGNTEIRVIPALDLVENVVPLLEKDPYFLIKK